VVNPLYVGLRERESIPELYQHPNRFAGVAGCSCAGRDFVALVSRALFNGNPVQVGGELERALHCSAELARLRVVAQRVLDITVHAHVRSCAQCLGRECEQLCAEGVRDGTDEVAVRAWLAPACGDQEQKRGEQERTDRGAAHHSHWS
jgi:hypothetical protein